MRRQTRLDPALLAGMAPLEVFFGQEGRTHGDNIEDDGLSLGEGLIERAVRQRMVQERTGHGGGEEVR